MGEDSGEKTEEPTPHKLREARKKGQIAKSQEITSAIMLLASFYTFRFTGHIILNRIADHTTLVFNLINVDFSMALAGMLLMDALKTIFLALGPLLAVTFILILIVESIQTGVFPCFIIY